MNVNVNGVLIAMPLKITEVHQTVYENDDIKRRVTVDQKELLTPIMIHEIPSVWHSLDEAQEFVTLLTAALEEVKDRNKDTESDG